MDQDNVCKIVPSQKGSDKINARGFLMVKDKNRDDLYYWCCEKRKSQMCNGRLTTIFFKGEHYIRKFTEHNHAPQASASELAKSVGYLKEDARNTRDQPCQIIQNNVINTSPDIRPYLPSKDALRKKIKRVRQNERPQEPKTLHEIDIPANLRKTLTGELFLVRDSVVGNERILTFTTAANVEPLSQAPYWIMDGTFKTVPLIFYQLYTIHAPVGTQNSRILPLVYALMTSKSEENYKRLFQDLTDFAEENNLQLKPARIISDLEKAAINASKAEYPDVTNKVCFFHLCQCGWRKIQASGLASKYGTDERFSLMLRHLFALAFIPANEIPTAFDMLRPHLPPDAQDICQWFEENYVHGRIRRRLDNGISPRVPPLFPPTLWCVYDSIQLGVPRTQNAVEAWHRRLESLVGRAHLGVYNIIENFQKEQEQVDAQVECILRGEQPPKRRKVDEEKEKRILTVVNDQPNRPVMDYLRGIAHNLSL